MIDKDELISVMKAEGVKAYPREACGLIVAVGKKYEIHVCRNVARESDQFMIAHEDQMAAYARGQIVGVWHTHPDNTPQPSEADRAGVEMTGVAWFILSVRSSPDGFNFEGPTMTEPTGQVSPYLNRPYVAGIFDCYSLIRDYYMREFFILLADYPRVLADGSDGNVVFIDRFAAEGFVRVEGDPQPGDVFLIQTGGTVPTHVALYVGDNMIMHHCHGRLSRRDIYGGYWLKHTTHHLRHKSKC